MEEKNGETRSEKKNQVEKDLDTFPKRERCFHKKTTSLEMNVVLVVQSGNLYPLNPVGYLRKIAYVNQGENFVL